MATTFKAQLLDNEHLPHNLRDEFYETMKQTVVVVRVCYDSGTTPTYWGGVCVGPEGLVVTAAHILPSNSKSVSFRCHGESNFVPANVIHTDVRSDLLLLRRKKIGDDCSRKIPYVECCPDADIHVGMEAIAIGHPCSMVYTIAIGHVAFPVCGLDDPYEKVPCADKTPNTRRMVDCKFGDCEDLEVHRDDLQLIQLNNIHGSMASAGSAIFTSAGLLLGVEIFVHSNFDFCVHIHTIKHFTEQGLKAEKTKGESSQGLLEMKKIKYPETEQKGRGKDGRKRNIVSLTKLRTDRERVKPQNLRPFEDIHTMASENCWKKTFEPEKATSAIADSQERTYLDRGFMNILLSSGRRSSIGKNEIDLDAESVPQNKKKPHFDKLDECEFGGDLTRLATFEMDMPDLDFSCPLKKTENARLNVSFLSAPGDGLVASSNICALYSGEKKNKNIWPGKKNSVQLPHGLSEQILATSTSKKILQNPLSSIACLPEISVEKQDISVRDSRLYDITNLFSRISKPKSKTSGFTMRRETKPVRFFERKLEVPPNSTSATVTKTNRKSSIPLCITDFVTPKRLLLEVSPTISKKLKVSPMVDKGLVLGTGNPEVYQGKAFMDNFGYSNCVPEMKNVANLELRTLIDGNVEKSEACAQELDDESEMDPKSSKRLLATITERRGFLEISSTINKEVDPGTGYEDNFSENESACSKNMVDLQLPVTSQSQNLNNGSVEKAAACAMKLDEICNMLRKKNEEAKELLDRCIVNSNALMMLNHPMYDDKILALQKRFKCRKF